MKVLFFGRYDPQYSRNRVLLKGLRSCGVEIIECRVSPSVSFWPFRLIWRYIRLRPRYDLMFVAFPGQEVMLIARLLTRKPILFDAFTSHYEGYVLDRATVRRRSLRALWFWLLDALACRFARVCFTDTAAHAQWFSKTFRISEEKLKPIFVGTDTDVFHPKEDPVGDFTVHFHGSYIPLQGVEVIFGAIRRLQGRGIRFQMIGPFTIPGELRNFIQYEPSVKYEVLNARMAGAHVCLGIFGTTEKTERVIPNKVFEALASRRAVITANTTAIRELLDEHSALLIPSGDADALAEAIRKLSDDPELCRRLADAGNQRFEALATPQTIGRMVYNILLRLHI